MKGKWAVLDGVDVGGRHSGSDERKCSEEERGFGEGEIMAVVGREEDA